MGQALYRKYRPKSLADVVGQEHITTTLEKAVKTGRISHAYLFSGPRGVGKTSIARILAHEVNGLPYTDDSVHLDIIEIDAASNRRIDEIRDLRDKVYIAPSSGKYKVYIIDEVHMLTREAFNALLKTLEEPPAHAVFILATTEAHKLPDTIISRTQHYTFRPVEQNKVIKHLADIAKKENIKINTAALELLAAHGQGSFRDSISLLDQAGSIGSSIEENEVRQLLGIAPETAIDQLITTTANGQASTILAQLSDLYAGGLQATNIASQLAAKIRSSLAANIPVLPVAVSLQLLRELIEVPASHNPARLLEIVLLDSTTNSGAPTVPTDFQPPATTYQELPKATTQADKPRIQPAPARKSEPAPIAVAQPTVPTQAETTVPSPVTPSTASGPAEIRELNEAIWPEVLASIKKQYNTIYGVLRMANPIFNTDSIELQFNFAFHQKRLNEAKNRQIIADFIYQVTGQNVAVLCTVHKGATPAAPNVTPPKPDNNTPAPIESITDIFGGGEVLNS